MVPETETSVEVILDRLQINDFLHRGRDENVKCNAFFLNLDGPNVFVSPK